MQLEPGLGESEEFYSWALASLNVGAVIGAFSSGILVKALPYWYLFLISLILHTVGYVIYAFATSGWHVMLSKLLSGLFIGTELTLGLIYISESNADYKATLKRLGEDDRKANHVKHRLFALHTAGFIIGDVIGTGISTELK